MLQFTAVNMHKNPLNYPVWYLHIPKIYTKYLHSYTVHTYLYLYNFIHVYSYLQYLHVCNRCRGVCIYIPLGREVHRELLPQGCLYIWSYYMVDATQVMGLGWGGVGVGMITFLALAHMVGATQHHVSCTCTHGRCYATSCSLHLHTWSVLRNIMFLALAHMVGATQLMGWGWGGDDNVPCTCTHGRCYATSCFLHLHTWSVLRNIMFLALAHMVGATQLMGWGWGGVGLGWGW